MLNSLNDISTSIHVFGKEVELYLNSSAIQLFIQNIEDLEPNLGFTSYEFAHLIYAAAVMSAKRKNNELEVNFLQIYETIKGLLSTIEGQQEIERIAKSFVKVDAYKELIANYNESAK